jgi:hypothetical protein
MLFWFIVFVVYPVFGLTVRNRTLDFKHSRTLESSTDSLLFVKTTEPVENAIIVGPDVYLVESDQVPTDALVATMEPEHKYSDVVLNETEYLVRFSREVDFVYQGCTSQPFYKTTYWINCTVPRVHDLIRDFPYIVSIDRIPRIHKMIIQIDNHTETVVDQVYSGNLLYDQPITMSKMIVPDNGFDPTHCAFPHHVETRYFEGITDNYAPPGSHGTSTTGVAVGANCNGFKGVATGAPYIAYDMSPLNGNPNLIAIPMKFFTDALTSEFDVNSMSWGSNDDAGEYTILDSIIDDHQYDFPHLLHVAAPGNGGSGESCNSPGSAKSVLSAGATNQRGEIAAFSSSAPMADGRVAADVYALGVNVITPYGLAYPPGNPSGHANFVYRDGTSFSTPNVSAMGLIEIERRKVASGGVRPYASLMRAVLMNTLPALSTLGGDVTDGRVLDANTRYWVGCYKNIGQFRLTLAWDDPPVLSGTSVTLVNDVDVQIVHDDGMDIGEDPKETWEKVNFQTFSSFRVIVYMYDNRTIVQAPLRFSSHINTVLQSEETCGTCFPGDISYENCSEGTFRQCLPLGIFSNCSSCAKGFLPVSNTTCACSTGLFIQTDNGLIQACTSLRRAPKITRNTGAHNQLSSETIISWLVLLLLLI